MSCLLFVEKFVYLRDFLTQWVMVKSPTILEFPCGMRQR